MKVKDADLNIIQGLEGFRSNVYQCEGNKNTIGYGHVIRPGEIFNNPITKEMALDLLKKDLHEFEKLINKVVKVPLTYNQFLSLVFFSFNIGSQAFKDSTLLKLLNLGHYEDVPNQMRRWNKINKTEVSKGLINRREREVALWLKK